MLEQLPHVLQMMLNRLNFRGGQEDQCPVAQRTQIHFIEEAVEQLRLSLHARGQRFQRLLHARTIRALDDDDDVFVLAKLSEVIAPALLIFLVRADKILALRFVLESRGGGPDRGAGDRQRQQQHDERIAAHDRHQTAQEATDSGALVWEDLFRDHDFRVPLGLAGSPPCRGGEAGGL